MNSRVNILNATKWTGSILLFIGITIFTYGFINTFYSALGIGIGTIVGAIFIFLMGMFFITTEEMVENTCKGAEVIPFKPRNGLYVVKNMNKMK